MSSSPSDPDPTPRRDLTDHTASIRAEWRAERRANETEAVRDLWSRRTVGDVLHETMRRGDEVAVCVHPSRTVVGTVVDAGRDYAVVAGGGRHLALRVASREGAADPYQGPQLLVEIRSRAPAGGRQASVPSSTFRAVLQRYDFQSQVEAVSVEVGTVLHTDPVVGALRALAVDHLYLRDRDDVEVFVPLSAVTYISWADTG